MNFDRLATRARALAPRVLAWIGRRARERSTWIGLAAAASALGWSTAAQHLTSIADIAPMLLGAGGAAIAAASTSPSSSADQPPA